MSSWFSRAHAIIAALLACVLAPGAAHAQSTYPNRPVRIVVPFAPAGGTDIMARSLAQRLSESLGRQVLVENRPGANALIGTEAVAKAAPDGHTLLMTTNIFTINPWLYPKIPFNVERDFAPITLAGSAPNLLAAHPSIPVHNVKEMIAFARARPGDVTIAAAGHGTPSHLAAELLKQAAPVDLLIVHYKGTGASLSDLVGGQVALSFGTLPGLAPFVKSGRVRPLAISGLERSPALPHVATVAETLPGFELLTWYGLFAPDGTPREIVEQLHAATLAALRSSEMSGRLAAQGFDARGTPPEEFAQIIRKDLARWKKVIETAKIQVD